MLLDDLSGNGKGKLGDLVARGLRAAGERYLRAVIGLVFGRSGVFVFGRSGGIRIL